MARLFISLYLFIVLALVGLSAGLDRLFFHDNHSSLTDSYILLLEQAKKHNIALDELTEALKLPTQNLSIKDISWSKEALRQLHSGQAIILNDPELGPQIYISDKSGKVFEIGLPQPEQDDFFLYSLIFFILLGVVVGMWVWPLYKDLSHLQKNVATVLPDGSIAKNKIGKTSIVFPIARSLNIMGEKIAQLMQNQRELSGAVAHEFRTPLARLKFALAMKPKIQSKPWLAMQEDVNELEKLVQEMLDYATTEAQIPEMNLAEIPIKQLCENLLKRFERSHFNHLQVTVCGDNAKILADEHFIERAIENLVLNAVRYAHKEIRLQILQHPENIDICIEDDGIGVAENFRDKIFLPFFRPDEGRDRERGGAGLGLAIVKRIATWHQGHCLVDTSTLGGARFSIRLPNLGLPRD